MRRQRFVLFVSAFFLLMALPAQAASEFPIATGAAAQYDPSATQDYVSWTQYNKMTKSFGTFVDDGVTVEQINRPKTNGFGGGFEGTTLYYQEVRPGTSDVVTYNVATDTRGTVPHVNSRFWDWGPTISGDWVLIGRNNVNFGMKRTWHRIVLVNISTGEKRTLATMFGKSASLWPGQVNGNVATWENCKKDDCDAFAYDIAAETQRKLPDAGLEYGAAVAPDGSIYFVRSGNGCGKNVRLYRLPPASSTTQLILSFPNGTDVWDTYLYLDGAEEDLYYSRLDCSDYNLDIYLIDDASTPFGPIHEPLSPSDDGDMSGAGAARAAMARANTPGMSR